MVNERLTFIPNLAVALCEPGQAEETHFEGNVIAKNFTTIFLFADGRDTWEAQFNIKISDLGTPTLLSVFVSGSVALHPKTPKRIYTKDNWNKFPISYTEAELLEFAKLNPEPKSVERWQLKVIEQYRFQLFELGIRLALQMNKRTLLKSASGEIRVLWEGKKEFSDKELKEIQKSISKKIRKKVKPEFLRDVAKLYTEAGLRGEKPIKAIEEFYKCSYRTAQDYATRARKAGFLPETTPGKITIEKPKKRKEKKK